MSRAGAVDGAGLSYTKWRRAMSSAGLLVEPEQAAAAVKAHQSVARGLTGVSLAFLKGMAGTLQGLPADGRTTLDVVPWIVHAGTVRMPPKEAPQQPGPTAAPSALARGTAQAAAGVVKEAAHVRLWDLVPPEHTGKPTHYVVHTWSGDCVDMLNAVVARLSKRSMDEEGEEGNDKAEDGDKSSEPQIFVWLDLVAAPQNAWAQLVLGQKTAPVTTYGPPVGWIDVDGVREIIASCDGGAVVCLDRDMALLNRAWPLYEAWAAGYYSAGAADGSWAASRLHVALPATAGVDTVLELQAACVKGLDMSRVECTRPEDKNNLMAEVKRASGLKRMQVALSEGLLRAMRTWLRWSGDPGHLAMYAAAALQAGELALLQFVLHTLPEIHDDASTFQEIREIFKVYDADGTGELEEDEFVAALGCAGFGEEEARAIFTKVDTDGGGSVGLQEFETWWIETQRQQARSLRPRPELTVNALVSNLHSLSGLLERRGMSRLAADITRSRQQLEGGFPSRSAPLPPYEVRVDFRSVAEQVAFKINSQDFRGAMRLMHTMLSANLDALDLESCGKQGAEGKQDNTQVHVQLPSPDELRDAPMSVVRAALAWFMALFAELLSRNTFYDREHTYFVREALDLAADNAAAGLPGHESLTVTSTVSTASALQAALTHHVSKRNQRGAAKPNPGRDAIVTDMVRLKYGKQAIISNRLIAEANVSLSTWMASQKSAAAKLTHKDSLHGGNGKGQGSSVASTSAALATMAVSDMAQMYLQTDKSANNRKDGGGNIGAAAVRNAKGNGAERPAISAQNLAQSLASVYLDAVAATAGSWGPGRSAEAKGATNALGSVPEGSPNSSLHGTSNGNDASRPVSSQVPHISVPSGAQESGAVTPRSAATKEVGTAFSTQLARMGRSVSPGPGNALSPAPTASGTLSPAASQPLHSGSGEEGAAGSGREASARPGVEVHRGVRRTSSNVGHNAAYSSGPESGPGSSHSPGPGATSPLALSHPQLGSGADATALRGLACPSPQPPSGVLSAAPPGMPAIPRRSRRMSVPIMPSASSSSASAAAAYDALAREYGMEAQQGGDRQERGEGQDAMAVVMRGAQMTASGDIICPSGPTRSQGSFSHSPGSMQHAGAAAGGLTPHPPAAAMPGRNSVDLAAAAVPGTKVRRASAMSLMGPGTSMASVFRNAGFGMHQDPLAQRLAKLSLQAPAHGPSFLPPIDEPHG